MNLLDSNTSKCQLKIKTFHENAGHKGSLDAKVNAFIKDNKILEEDIVEIRTLCCAENIALNDKSSVMHLYGEIFLTYILIYRERHFDY